MSTISWRSRAAASPCGLVAGGGGCVESADASGVRLDGLRGRHGAMAVGDQPTRRDLVDLRFERGGTAHAVALCPNDTDPCAPGTGTARSHRSLAGSTRRSPRATLPMWNACGTFPDVRSRPLSPPPPGPPTPRPSSRAGVRPGPGEAPFPDELSRQLTMLHDQIDRFFFWSISSEGGDGGLIIVRAADRAVRSRDTERTAGALPLRRLALPLCPRPTRDDLG